MTHSELCKVACKWLKNTIRCGVVAVEPVCASLTGEIPDAIGFVATSARTVLVECKTSRSDFLKDKKKFHRNDHCSTSLGAWRFFLISGDFVTEKDIPDGWGVYLYDGKKVVHKFGVKWSNAGKPPFSSYHLEERQIMYSMLRKSK